MVLTLSKSEVSVVGSVSGSFGKAVLLLFNAFFCPPESLSLSWPGALLRPRSTCGSNWPEFGSHGKMRVFEYFLLDNPDVVTWMPCWPSDLGRFWGAREVKMWGGGAFMVVGTLPLPRSWGTNNSGLLARSLRTGGPSQHWEIMYI